MGNPTLLQHSRRAPLRAARPLGTLTDAMGGDGDTPTGSCMTTDNGRVSPVSAD